MKKISFIGLFYILFAYTCNAQGIYSKQNLEKNSMDVLNLHLEKAQKLKKAGVIMSIAGPVGCIAGITIAGLAYSGGTEGEFRAGLFLFLGGMITTFVGLPTLAIGSTRVKRIKAVKNAHQGASLHLSPGFVYNNKTQNLFPEVSLKVRFQ